MRSWKRLTGSSGQMWRIRRLLERRKNNWFDKNAFLNENNSSFLKSWSQPLVLKCLNSWVTGLNFLLWVQHVVTVVCLVVLCIPLCSCSNLNVRTVRIWRLKTGNSHQISLRFGIILWIKIVLQELDVF